MTFLGCQVGVPHSYTWLIHRESSLHEKLFMIFSKEEV